jgi:tRNA (guanine-N7-)-methyltransferase
MSVSRAKLLPRKPYEITWEDLVLGGGIHALYADPSLPLEVEIGPGEDEHLYDSARAHPEHNWLGIEYSRKRVLRYIRNIERREEPLPNLRLIWRPAPDLVAPFLSPEQVAAYHVYFPDPWPKAHHARYRLLTPPFVADLYASLQRGGRIDLATDSAEYADEVREAFATVPRLMPEPIERYEIEERHASSSGRLTVFEARWRAIGREIQFLRYRKEA